MHPDAGDELVERERLREVVVRAEVEAAQLRRQVGARGEDEHRQVCPCLPKLREQAQTVDARQEQVEDHEFVRAVERKSQAGGAVLGGVDDEALRLESQSQEVEDPGLILDDENAHGPRRPYKAARAVQHLR